MRKDCWDYILKKQGVARQEVLDGWLKSATFVNVDLTQTKSRNKYENMKDNSNLISTNGRRRFCDPEGDGLDICQLTDNCD